MGIPYSRQINATFDQVTPLVGSAYKVLETTKNIAILLAFVQIYTAFVLTFVLIALFGLLLSMNSDLDKERDALVTPTMQWLASWMMDSKGRRKSLIGFLSLISAMMLFGVWLRMHLIKNVAKKDKAANEAADDSTEEKA